MVIKQKIIKMYLTEEDIAVKAKEICKLINFNFDLKLIVDDFNRVLGKYDEDGDVNFDRLNVEIFNDGSYYLFWYGEKTGDYVCKNVQEVLLCMNIYLGFKKTAIFLDIPENN